MTEERLSYYYQRDYSKSYESDCAVDELESIVVAYAATAYSGYEDVILINDYDSYGIGGMYLDNQPKVLSYFGIIS